MLEALLSNLEKVLAVEPQTLDELFDVFLGPSARRIRATVLRKWAFEESLKWKIAICIQIED